MAQNAKASLLLLLLFDFGQLSRVGQKKTFVRMHIAADRSKKKNRAPNSSGLYYTVRIMRAWVTAKI